MHEIKYRPIGIIHSPFKEPKGTPIQPAAAKGIGGKVEVFSEYAEGLKDVFKEPKGTPIQPAAAKGIGGKVEVFSEYAEGLKDVEGFSHIILVCHFHLSGKPSLKVKPFMDTQMRGVFATRAPSRPNPIGISIVRLVKIEENILHVQDVDIVDGTPLLDSRCGYC